MTQQTEKPKARLVFATKTFQQVPFSLGGQTFLSKRLTAEEELLLQEAQSIAALGLKPNDDLLAQSTVLAGILRKRAQNGDIDVGWTEQHIGPSNLTDLTLFLRTGHNGPGLIPREGETFDLTEVEPMDIGSRTFAGHLMNFAEYRQLRSAMNEMELVSRVGKLSALGENPEALAMSGTLAPTLEGMADLFHEQTDLQRQKAQVVACILSSRIADEGEAVDGAWLLDNLSLEQMEELLNFYLTGKNKEPEGDTPNADLTPGNLQLNA